MPPLAPVTKALLLINVAIFCVDYILGGQLTRWFALYPIGPNFLPWQLVTYAFLHDVNNLFHIIFNMLGLWMFGAELERLWGPKRYLQYYAASVLSAGLSQLVLSALLGSQAPTIGASGGIFGLLLAFGMMFPNRQIMLLIPPIPMKAKIFVAIYGALELFLGVANPYGGVAHFAHLGGMLGGFLMIQYWRGKPPFGRSR
jgi:membrane associated rhomboid family serine protease